MSAKSVTLPERFAAEAHAVLEPLDVERYYRMMEAGVIPEGAAIELIDGLLVRKDRRDRKGDIRTVGTRHRTAILRVLDLMRSRLSGALAHIQSQQPIDLNCRNAPEPDVAVVHGVIVDFTDHHPLPGETALVIEVADSSLAFDLGRKQELYCEAGIAEYSVVNLREDVMEVFRGPRDQTWTERLRLKRGETIAANLAGQSVTLSIDEISGPPPQ